MQGHNTLLLDEPTNHLDIGNRTALETALAGFTGTLIVVSHDRRFLDAMVDRLVIFPSADRSGSTGRVEVFLGNYTDLSIRRAAERARSTGAITDREQRAASAPSRPLARGRSGEIPGASPAEPVKLSKNEQARRRAWIAEVEAEIAESERRRDTALTEMSDPTLDVTRRRELAELCEELDAAIDERLQRWEQWHREIDESTEAPATDPITTEGNENDGRDA
jgi:DNA repair exonuclease SbcCD ATPase subunit